MKIRSERGLTKLENKDYGCEYVKSKIAVFLYNVPSMIIIIIIIIKGQLEPSQNHSENT
jgi:hypothetical protein